MEEIIVAIRSFLEAGGDVLYLIAAATFCMWALIFERVWFINTEHKSDVGKAVAYSLKQWLKRVRYLDNGNLAIDNKRQEHHITFVTLKGMGGANPQSMSLERIQ